MRTATLSILSVAVMAGFAVAGDFAMIDSFVGYNLYTRQSGTNLQNFTGSLGGATADPIYATGNDKDPFSVGTETFTKLSDAVQRSCANQFQTCQETANGPNGGGGGGSKSAAASGAVTVSDCTTQQTQCNGFGESKVVASATSEANSGSTTAVVVSSTSISTTSTSTQATSTLATAQVVTSVGADFFVICDL